MKILITAIALATTMGPISGDESPEQLPPTAKQPPQVFTISRPANGRYTPRRDKNETWFAGAIITIKDQTFRYEQFTDVAFTETPDYTGKLQVFEDHIFLDHPGVPYPYQVAGVMNGRPVLLSWEAYQSWKKNGSVTKGYILYLQKTDTDAQQPATKPSDKPPVKDQPSTPTSKDAPRQPDGRPARWSAHTMNRLEMIKTTVYVLLGLLPVMEIDAETVRVGEFDDALEKIAATFEAKPGQPAKRDWTAPSGGSVRMVGSLQKLSMKAEAEVDVQVDGHTIWHQKLGVTDSIRHGFDITAYDLESRSKVDFRVMAGREPVIVSAAFQIMPEPFVSRWRADLPADYPTWPEDHRIALRNKGKEILLMLRDASASKLGKIVIPPGDYLFHADWSRASTLVGLENLEIIAEGVTFWFEPPMVYALLFEKCRNVSVRGLSIDFTIPCWFQARVTKVDRTAKTIRATLMAGYEPRNASGEVEPGGKRALMFYGADGRFINHRHSPGAWQLAEDGKSVVCRDIELSGIPGTLNAGDYVVGTIRTGAALRSVNCAGMRFEDVNIWSSPGMAVNEGGGEGGHVYRRVRATRRPHTNRLHAFGADIFHLAGTDRGPTLDRCELAYGADDNLNIHGSFGRVVQRVDSRHYHLQGAYAAGDRIEFRDQSSVALLGVARVVSAKETPNGQALPIGDKHQAKGEVLVELDKPLELPQLSLVVLDGKRSAGGFVLRNCWLHDNFQRTLINGSPGGLIENNTLQNVGHGLVIQFETWGPWMEGPFARDLTVRGNRFLDAPPDGAAIGISMHPPGGGSNARRFEARPVTNVTITGNDFARTSTTPLIIHNVDGLKIQGNNIDYPADATNHVGPGNPSGVNWLYLQDCVNVAAKDNQSSGAAESGSTRPRQ